MEIKINTKEKFTVIDPVTAHLTDTLSLELLQTCQEIFDNAEQKNIVLNLQSIASIDVEAANNIANLQQKFYEENTSFVICEMQKSVEDTFEKLELLEIINVTPSESEAWDIVQIEEIERELLDGEEEV